MDRMSQVRAGLFVLFCLLVVVGVYFALGLGYALIFAGALGMAAVVTWSYLSVTNA